MKNFEKSEIIFDAQKRESIINHLISKTQIPFEEAEKIVDDEEDEKEMTPEEKAKMWKMIQMMGGIEKKSITKQIEGR